MTTISFIGNPRMGICAPEGKTFLSVDFSSQELLIAAAWSQDPVMMRSFKESEIVTQSDGTTYPNPHADLHTMSTVGAVAPELFKDQPESTWVKIAKSSGKRKYGKNLNFSLLYLATAQTVAKKNLVKVEVAQLWVDGHHRTYAGYHEWAEEYGSWAVARGFNIVPVSNRIKWVDEDNAKGSGESPHRSAVNSSIQSACADIAKECLIRIRKRLLGTRCLVLGLVHDEILLEVPGKCEIDYDHPETIIKDGILTSIKFKVDEEAKHWGNIVAQLMCDTETEFINRGGSDLVGRASIDYGYYWAH